MQNKDITSKTLFKRMVTDLANILLRLDIDPESVELLETQHQRIEERRADLVARVHGTDSNHAKILHIEIQNDNDADMPLRMLRYYTDIRFAHHHEPIHQYVIYIGKRALKMRSQIDEHDWFYRYNILDMRNIDCHVLLEQDNPDALVMAVLCDFKDQPKQDVVNYIAFRLKALLQDDEYRFENYFTMLQILAQNRHLEQEIQACKTMLTDYDVTKFATYQWGIEKGEKTGEQKGKLKLAQQLLQQGIVDDKTIAQILNVPVESLSHLVKTDD